MTDDVGAAVAHQDVQHPLLVSGKWFIWDDKTNNFQADPKIILSSDYNVKKGKRGPR